MLLRLTAAMGDYDVDTSDGIDRAARAEGGRRRMMPRRGRRQAENVDEGLRVARHVDLGERHRQAVAGKLALEPSPSRHPVRDRVEPEERSAPAREARPISGRRA